MILTLVIFRYDIACVRWFKAPISWPGMSIAEHFITVKNLSAAIFVTQRPVGIDSPAGSVLTIHRHSYYDPDK